MENHASATNYTADGEEYLSTELPYKAIIGPFAKPPFLIHISSLMTRLKEGSAKRRTIVDLGWPNKHKYLDTYFRLQCPFIDNIIDAFIKLGPGAMLYKVDISRIEPRDIDLLGLRHKYTFLDVTLPLRFCHGSIFFTGCSDAICHIMWQLAFNGLWNYIDDLIYTGLLPKIYQSDTFLLQLLQQVGLDISAEKLVPPLPLWYVLGLLLIQILEPFLFLKRNLKRLNNYVILGKVKVLV